MNPPPSRGEEQRETPALPRPAPTLSPPESPPPAETLPQPSRPAAPRGRFSFVASILLIAIAFSLGLSYLLEKRWPQRSVDLPFENLRPAKAGQTTTSTESFNPEMLHVTAIFPGPVRSALVNGQKIAEGDSFMLPLASGPATVRLDRVDNGVVHFIFGGERIDVKVKAAIAQQRP